MDYKRGAGGSPGGLGEFFIGLIMALAGGYMLTTQIHVTSGFWGMTLFGSTISAFGATLIPFLIGVGLIFFNASSKVGWLLAGGSFFFIIIGVLVNLRVYFAATSLYVTLIMLVLLAGGIGLMARALRAH